MPDGEPDAPEDEAAEVGFVFGCRALPVDSFVEGDAAVGADADKAGALGWLAGLSWA